MSNPVLEICNLSKSFGALKATDDVSLDLRKGEIHALIGPNGAGKSTLIAQIAGTLAPERGVVRFMGRDVTRVNAVGRARRGLGRTFQISALAPEFTVLQNAVLGVVGGRGRVFRFFRNAMRDADLVGRAMAALERAGLQEVATTQVGALSHGQRRQLEVAVALTLEPRAMVMDEPMAGLGASGSARLTGFLDGLRREVPILLVEHDMDAVFALADRISVLVNGRIVVTGTVDEIRAHPEVRSAYLGDGDI
jgi:branched-chain amino acid transport system ATP-binding protein